MSLKLEILPVNKEVCDMCGVHVKKNTTLHIFQVALFFVCDPPCSSSSSSSNSCAFNSPAKSIAVQGCCGVLVVVVTLTLT